MARKERKGGGVARLDAEMAAGDWRAARGGARALAGSTSEPDRAAATRVLQRLRPGPTAAAAFLAGLALLAVVAGLGLFHR